MCLFDTIIREISVHIAGVSSVQGEAYSGPTVSVAGLGAAATSGVLSVLVATSGVLSVLVATSKAATADYGPLWRKRCGCGMTCDI